VSPASSPIARVIAELENERENLTVRLTKVDAAIATMRELFHLPNGRPAIVRRRQSVVRKQQIVAPANGNGSTRRADKVQAAIAAALARGPLSSADLAARVGLKRPALLYHTVRMKRTGVLVTTGAASSTQYALAGKPAKEAPQR
jgi:hypothetical protein